MKPTIDKELLKKIQQIDIRLRRKVNNLFSGQYRSAFKGQGMIFSDFREYIPGDDIRTISWNLTAKMSKPFIKTFEEDRETQVILMIDASASLDFGTGKNSKTEVVQMLSSLVAFCAQKNQDAIGLLIFTDDVEVFIPPKKGIKHVFHIIREICSIKRKARNTDVSSSVHFLQKVLQKKSHIFLFSDFLWPDEFSKNLKFLGSRHDVISVAITDPLEKELPNLGLVDLQDLETGQMMTVDLSAPWTRKQYKEDMQAARQKRNKQLLLSKSEQILVDTSKDIYEPFMEFFQKRSQSRTRSNHTGL